MRKFPITTELTAKARDTTGAALQNTLVDLIDLSLVAKQAHWNVMGANFRSVHLQLDELVAITRLHVDAVAERASALGVSPDGRASTTAKDSGLPDYPTGWQADTDTIHNIVTTLEAAIARLRPRLEETDESDPVSQDLLIAVTKALEEAHWMWQAQTA